MQSHEHDSQNGPPSSSLPPPSPREPIISVPGIILLFIGLLIVIHILRGFASPERDLETILTYGFIPARFSLMLDAGAFSNAISRMVSEASKREAPQILIMSQHLVREDQGRLWTFMTYAMLHGSWAHLVVNSVMFLAFGTPVARRLGAIRTLALFVLTSIAGAILHWLIHSYAFAPVIGASAGCAGMTAAACRFAFPGGRQGSFLNGQAQSPLLSVVACLRNRQIGLFIIIWMVTNLIFGVFAVPLNLSEGGIAWEAHIGGFVAGFFLIALLDRPQRVQS
jgi:membrane associated rhomboid family serine protease